MYIELNFEIEYIRKAICQSLLFGLIYYEIKIYFSSSNVSCSF